VIVSPVNFSSAGIARLQAGIEHHVAGGYAPGAVGLVACGDVVESFVVGHADLGRSQPMCRDMIFHLSLADGQSALKNILSKPRRYLISTTDTVTDINGEIITGDFRPRNLLRPPFNLPAPVEVIDDSIVEPGRKIGVWRAEDVRKALGA